MSKIAPDKEYAPTSLMMQPQLNKSRWQEELRVDVAYDASSSVGLSWICL
jgi:hypothetical protein